MFGKNKYKTYGMTDKKKVQMLLDMLDEKDKEINALRNANGELMNRLENGSTDEIADLTKELDKAISSIHRQEKEYKKLIYELKVVKKKYLREMERVIDKIPKG